MNEKVPQRMYNIIPLSASLIPEYAYLISNPLYKNASSITQHEYGVLTNPIRTNIFSAIIDDRVGKCMATC